MAPQPPCAFGADGLPPPHPRAWRRRTERQRERGRGQGATVRVCVAAPPPPSQPLLPIPPVPGSLSPPTATATATRVCVRADKRQKVVAERATSGGRGSEPTRSLQSGAVPVDDGGCGLVVVVATASAVTARHRGDRRRHRLSAAPMATVSVSSGLCGYRSRSAKLPRTPPQASHHGARDVGRSGWHAQKTRAPHRRKRPGASARGHRFSAGACPDHT